MLKPRNLLLVGAAVSLCLTTVIRAQDAPTTGGPGRLGAGPGGPPPGAFGGRGNNDMVSMTPPANVKRVKIYDTMPNVVAGTENELNPMEPTLDLYLPDTNKASGTAVLLLPGGGYSMLTVPDEGATQPCSSSRTTSQCPRCVPAWTAVSLPDDAAGRTECVRLACGFRTPIPRAAG